MRLINAETYEMEEFLDQASRPKYAILSHRWVADEITFAHFSPSELQDESLQKPALRKIRGTCRAAMEEKLY